MDHKSEVMREQMQDTRTALQDKLETLEQQVKDTVLVTTDAVTETVEAAKETVETVKETVQSVKDAVNLSHMVKEHPWPMFAGAVGLGFVSARLLGSISSGGTSTAEPATPAPRSEPAAHRNGFSASRSAAQPAAPPQTSWLSLIADHYSEELAKLQGLAIATVGNVVCELVTENAAPEIAARTKELIDGIITKFGAKPIEEPIFNTGAVPVEPHNDVAKPF